MTHAGLDASGAVIGQYEFLEDFQNSAIGLPALEAQVGDGAEAGFLPGKGWSWAPEGVLPAPAGLRLDTSAYSGTGLMESYSIGMTFEFSQTEGYRKLIDFSNLTDDAGLYVSNDTFLFYGGESTFLPDDLVLPDTKVSFVVTRTAGGTVSLYVMGQTLPILVFDDSENHFTISTFSGGETSESWLSFFLDDSITGGEFSSSGAVYQLVVWDTVLSPEEVEAHFSTIPEPVTFPLLGGAALAVAAFRRRRNRA